MTHSLNRTAQLLLALMTGFALSPLVHAQSREETSLWENIKDSRDAEDYLAYLDKYPEGAYAPLAKRRAAAIKSTATSRAARTQEAPPAGDDVSQAPSKRKATAPVTMTECEGTNNCATWTFLGAQGNGTWPSGETANLSVEHFDANSVVIRRADSVGPSAGLTAEYHGSRHGDRIGGEFTSSWPGHWENKSGNWYATIGEGVQSIPNLMHFCAQHCMTLVWEHDHYASNTGGTWTVVSFIPQLVMLNRVEPSGFRGSYKGAISSEGDSLVNVVSSNDPFTEDGTPTGPAAYGNFRIVWGKALNSVPGSDGPAPAIVARPLICVPWFFTVVCD